MYGMSVDAPVLRRHGMEGNNLYHTYEIESKLGSGGSGTVYKAWHRRLQKHIVLKEIKDSAKKTVEVRRNEIEALKNVKNMYVPQVFDFLTEKSSSFTVMEYIEGDSFDKLLAEGTFFKETEIVKWFYQLATALEELHANDVCHRDIKPGNIIKKLSGDVCLIDFNSALVRGNNTGVVSRSLGYASPEQVSYFQICEDAYRELRVAQGAKIRHQNKLWIKGIDWKLSDIYSLGATMYHLLTGERPPLRANDHLLTVAEKYMPLKAGIKAVIERCMHVSPSERFVSANELRIALQQYYYQQKGYNS